MGRRNRERKALIRQGREDLHHRGGRDSKVPVDDGGWDPFGPPPFLKPHAPLSREEAEALFMGKEGQDESQVRI